MNPNVKTDTCIWNYQTQKNAKKVLENIQGYPAIVQKL